MSMNRSSTGTIDINQSIVPASGKIYDITHADTNEHSVALPAGYPANTKAIYVIASRIAGTGYFAPRSVTGQGAGYFTNSIPGFWFRGASGLFYYNLTVANDDFDIFAVGFITA